MYASCFTHVDSRTFFVVIMDICMHECKMYEILNITFTIIVCALLRLSNIQVNFMIIPFVLRIDPGVVSEVEHSKLPSQKRKSDDGNPY